MLAEASHGVSHNLAPLALYRHRHSVDAGADRQTRARLLPLMDLYEARGDGVAIDHTASGGGVLRLPAPHPRALDNVLLLSRRIAALSSRLWRPVGLSAKY